MRKLESSIERQFYDKVLEDENECIKIEKRHWPDRLVVIEHGHCFYIEFKREGEKPRKGQRAIHRLLHKKGHKIYVCDSYEKAIEAYTKERLRAKRLSNSVY